MAESLEEKSKSEYSGKSIAIIGAAGKVGSNLAEKFLLTKQGLNLYLVDKNLEHLDKILLPHFKGFKQVQKGYADVQLASVKEVVKNNMDISIVCIDAVPKEKKKKIKKRSQLLEKNIFPMIELSEQFKDYEGNVIVVTNPLDIMTYAFCTYSGMPVSKIVGYNPDSRRFNEFLQERLKTKEIGNAFVIGEHSDAMVPVFSRVKYEKSFYDKTPTLKDMDYIREQTVKFGTDYLIALGEYEITDDFFTICDMLLKNSDETASMSNYLFLNKDTIDVEIKQGGVFIGYPFNVKDGEILLKKEFKPYEEDEQIKFIQSYNGIEQTLRKFDIKEISKEQIFPKKAPKEKQTDKIIIQEKIVRDLELYQNLRNQIIGSLKIGRYGIVSPPKIMQAISSLHELKDRYVDKMNDEIQHVENIIRDQKKQDYEIIKGAFTLEESKQNKINLSKKGFSLESMEEFAEYCLYAVRAWNPIGKSEDLEERLEDFLDNISEWKKQEEERRIKALEEIKKVGKEKFDIRDDINLVGRYSKVVDKIRKIDVDKKNLADEYIRYIKKIQEESYEKLIPRKLQDILVKSCIKKISKTERRYEYSNWLEITEKVIDNFVQEISPNDTIKRYEWAVREIETLNKETFHCVRSWLKYILKLRYGSKQSTEEDYRKDSELHICSIPLPSNLQDRLFIKCVNNRSYSNTPKKFQSYDYFYTDGNYNYNYYDAESFVMSKLIEENNPQKAIKRYEWAIREIEKIRNLSFRSFFTDYINKIKETSGEAVPEKLKNNLYRILTKKISKTDKTHHAREYIEYMINSSEHKIPIDIRDRLYDICMSKARWQKYPSYNESWENLARMVREKFN